MSIFTDPSAFSLRDRFLAVAVCLLLITGCGGESTEPADGEEPSSDETTLTEDEAEGGLVATAPATGDPADEGLPAEETDDNKPIAELEVPDVPNRLFVELQNRKEEYEGGQPKREYRVKMYSDGSLVNDGEYVEWYPSGQKYKEGKFVDGLEQGEWTFWHENGQIAKQPSYVEGKLDGKWTVLREDGSPIEERSYIDGKRHGTFVAYDESGEQKLSERRFQQGEPEGTWIEWYPDGEKKVEVEFLNGKLHGVKQQWYDNGQLAAREDYRAGRLHGEQQQWDKEGNLVVERTFKEGELVP